MANRPKMAEQQAIIALAQRGWSFRRIARELGDPPRQPHAAWGAGPDNPLQPRQDKPCNGGPCTMMRQPAALQNRDSPAPGQEAQTGVAPRSCLSITDEWTSRVHTHSKGGDSLYGSAT
jgi:hypothetical protein